MYSNYIIDPIDVETLTSYTSNYDIARLNGCFRLMDVTYIKIERYYHSYKNIYKEEKLKELCRICNIITNNHRRILDPTIKHLVQWNNKNLVFLNHNLVVKMHRGIIF